MPLQQAQDFGDFIIGSECLSKHRGAILPRNSCRLPFFQQVNNFWQTQLSVRYSF